MAGIIMKYFDIYQVFHYNIYYGKEIKYQTNKTL